MEFLRRLLGKSQETRKDPDKAAKKIGVGERILQTPITRRSVLGGTASATGAILGDSVPFVGPDAISRAKKAARLSHSNLGEYLSDIPYSKIPDWLSHLDAKLIGELGRKVYELGISLSDQEELKTIADLKDREMLLESERIRNHFDFTNPEEREMANEHADDILNGIKVLQQIAGVPDQDSVTNFQKVLGGKVFQMARHVVDTPGLLPPLGTYDRVQAFLELRATLGAIGMGREAPAYQEFLRLEQEAQDSRQIGKSMEGEKQYGGASAEPLGEIPQGIREHSESVIPEERFDVQVPPGAIGCDVEYAARKARDGDTAKVFLIRPRKSKREAKLPEISRMHIQHLRQLLTVGDEKILDNFDPASTRVETESNYARVSTTDRKLQDYLSSFVGGGRPLLIPNRLQTVSSSEEEVGKE